MFILFLLFLSSSVYAKVFDPEVLCKKVHGTAYYAQVQTCRAGTYALKANGIPVGTLATRVDTRLVCILIDRTHLNALTPKCCGRWHPLCITCYDGANDPTIPKQYVFIP
jgi:hypothetical protein